MTSELDFQLAQPEDVPAVTQLLRESVQYKESKGDEIWSDYPFTEEEVAETVAKGDTYIAYLDGKPAASMRLQWEDERIWGEQGTDQQAAYLHRLVRGDDFAGENLGPKAVDWAKQKAREAGKHLLRLDCSTANEGLCRYYTGLGFTATRSIVMDYEDEGSYDPTLFEIEL